MNLLRLPMQHLEMCEADGQRPASDSKTWRTHCASADA
jgi:hypothetical protein